MGGEGKVERATAAKLTYDDFVHFPDDGLRHELIDGEHYVTPSPATVHQRLVRELLVVFDAHLKSAGTGEVFVAPFDVVLSDHDVVEPDLLVVLAEQSEIVTDKHVRGAPALVVEILSPGTRRRDEGIKSRAYERWGVREYWLVDPKARSIAVRRRDGAGLLNEAGVVAAGSAVRLSSPLLPQFSLDVAELFGRV